MKRNFAVGLSALALAISGITVVAPSAGAAPAAVPTARAAAGCSNPLHTYQHYNYTGGWKQFCSSDNNLSNNEFNNGVRVNDRISSVKNLGHSCSWTLYQHSFQRGRATTFKPWSWDGNLGNNNIGDNKTSSLKKRCL
ncbi:hypothetical protein [Streptomyces sp. NPDC005407]|jgi:hypothetical protein|uniref:hypothetical protein n=1 Tax=Streptomyces sp. NPDC005407 TaxID=3155340 RepID=UPI0033A057DC